MRRRIEGILIHLDGTFIDSNDSRAKAWWEALKDNGIQLELKAVKESLAIGPDNLFYLAKIKRESKQAQQIETRATDLFREVYLPKVKAFPGGQQLLSELRKRHLKIIVISSAMEGEFKALLRQANMDNNQEHVASTSVHDTYDKILEAAFAKLNLGPRSVIYIGESPVGIEAAENLSIQTMAFTSGGWNRAALKFADYVFAGPQELYQALQNPEKDILQPLPQ